MCQLAFEFGLWSRRSNLPVCWYASTSASWGGTIFSFPIPSNPQTNDHAPRNEPGNRQPVYSSEPLCFIDSFNIILIPIQPPLRQPLRTLPSPAAKLPYYSKLAATNRSPGTLKNFTHERAIPSSLPSQNSINIDHFRLHNAFQKLISTFLGSGPEG